MDVSHIGAALPVQDPAFNPQPVRSQSADIAPEFLKTGPQRNQAGGSRRLGGLPQRGSAGFVLVWDGAGKNTHDGLEIHRHRLGGRSDDVLVVQVGDVHQI